MVGRKAGVATLLQREQSALVVVHCFAHKLELAFESAVKQFPLYGKVVKTLLMGLYYFYYNGYLNTDNRSILKRSLVHKMQAPIFQHVLVESRAREKQAKKKNHQMTRPSAWCVSSFTPIRFQERSG